MRTVNVHQSVLSRISKRLPMNWFKKGSALFALILLGMLLGHGSAAGEVHISHIDLVSRLEVDRFGIGQPFGLTSDPIAGTLLLLDGRTKELHTITTFSDRLATDQINDIPAGARHIEYDARSGTLLTFEQGQHQLMALPWRETNNGNVRPGDSHTAVTTPLEEVHGIAVDPATGDVYLLDGDSRQLIHLATIPKGAPLELEPDPTIALGGSETGALRGLAFNPLSRHLFTYNPTNQQLLEFTLDGAQSKVYDLSPFNLSEPVALAFAPSTDQTDDPSAVSLYIASGGTDADIWEFTFAPPVPLSLAATAATLVQTIDVWNFSPPSPDASGATYLPHSNRLLETDSEVNEKSIYQDVNQFEMELDGSLINTYDTTHFSREPTGIAFDPDRNHLFFTDDNAKMVYESDLSYNMVNSFPVATLDGKSVDPEGIAYNTFNGRLYIAGGTSNTMFWIDPGADNDFGTSDDLQGSFPATNLSDPEGITFNTDNGNLYGVGKSDVVAEYTIAGSVVQMIDISAASAMKPAGLAYGPTSVGGGKSIYVTDRGVDADSGINGGKGDGKIYEFALGPVGPPPEPTADFTGSPTSGPVSLTADFSNTSTGIYTTCLWDFGDTGSSSECDNPSHTYDTVGTYDVTLTVTGPGGSDTKTEVSYIQVVEPAIASFSANPTEGNVPETVIFINSSTGVYDTCSWDFGDGGSSSNCTDSHEYTAGGVYTVSLTVSGIGGSSTETKSGYITMHQAPAVDFNGTPTSGPAPLTVNFSNLTTGDFETCEWDFGDPTGASISPDCNDPSHTYADPGWYTVKLSVDGSLGADSLTKTNYIHVGVPVVAAFSGSPTTGIAPQAVNFVNSSSGDINTCQWDFGDGSTSSDCANPEHIYTVAGSYTVSLTVSGTGGSQTATKTNYITVNEAGNANFSADPRWGVAPLAVTFSNLSLGDFNSCLWNFGDGSTSQSCADPTHTYTTPGIYTVSLAIDGSGGPDLVTFTNLITVYETVKADFSAAPRRGIVPLTVSFENLTSGEYNTCLWTFGDDETSSDCDNPSHTFSSLGSYTIELVVIGSSGSDTARKINYISVEPHLIRLPLILRN